MIGLLQVNLHRSREAHDLMESTTVSLNVGVCLMTEPNRAKVVGSQWQSDESKDTAIWCDSSRYVVSRRGCGTSFSWVEVEGVVIYSCYLSPNRSLEEFLNSLEEIGRSLESVDSHMVVVTGDFNAHAVEWGGNRTCKRGVALMEWMIQRDLYIQNDGKTPTFYRRHQESYIDLTMCSRQMVSRIKEWRVLEDCESLSDHRYIGFSIQEAPKATGSCPVQSGHIRSFGKFRNDVLKEEVVKGCQGLQNPDEEAIMTVLTRACELAGKPVHPRSRARRPKYWWNSEIAESRQECNKVRRVCTRARGQATDEQLEAYRAARKDLRKLIRKSKEAMWKQLCEEIEQDPWGKGYKIAMKKLGGALPKLPDNLVSEIVETLFPEQEIGEREVVPIEDFPPITVEEVHSAGRRIAKGKAPGPDGIPPEATRYLLLECPHVFQKVAEKLLKEGRFPVEWKKATLVLIPKPGKTAGTPSAYRPLCLLSTVGKAMEAIISARLVAELEQESALSENQHGFRRGHSTLTALKSVMEVAEKERRQSLRTRGLCLVILLDVKNAFNSMNWAVILRCMAAKGCSPYLRRIVASYLEDRQILLGGSSTYEVTAGVPQGSILGPTLWNLAYNGVLELNMPEGVRSVAYADDLALVITAKGELDLENRANEALFMVERWMSQHYLKLAPEKTEAILLIGRKKCRSLDIHLDGHKIEPQKEVRYLGVILDQGLTGSAHVRQATDKASKAVAGLSRLMPNLGGPGEGRRRLLATVADSITLYGAPIWEKAMKSARNRKLLTRTQRRLALRICRAFRTVSTTVTLVLARTVPWHLAVKERSEIHHDSSVNSEEAREKTLERWQREWDAVDDPTGRWTKKLMPSIKPWISRSCGDISYYLTQVLTGHGCFQEYFSRFSLAPSPTCILCESGEPDDAKHTLESCSYFQEKRISLENVLQKPFAAEGIVRMMLESSENWLVIGAYVESIMREKVDVYKARGRRN
jgi:Reverse transcriptase (RNA-dependent DNA polymerase)/Endonuclease-reverse transcriptase